MILITGAAGFIGYNYVMDLDDEFVVVDNLTYAANRDILNTNILFEEVDICDIDKLETVFAKYPITSVIHFAAESHVDNAIKDCMPFVYSNIIGTVNLLQLSVKYNIEKFLQISTDEVFGQIIEGSFNEYSLIQPRNPYSASKASAEHFVNAFNQTYGLPTLLVNCSNNYGPYQYKEKLIPLTINNLVNGKNVPIYGNGLQVRDWIYVKDSCSAIKQVFNHGIIGDRYCIGSDNETTNLDLVRKILKILNLSEDRIEFITDRPGHDTRYHTDWTKMNSHFNWNPKYSLDDGLEQTIEWYLNNAYF